MNILLVSQCNKRALTETRRILDQFAERKGDRTWQTAITLQGLDTLRKLLKKTAKRNTAVACHWIKGANQTELLWIVGNLRQFNEQGTVPTNTTSRDILRSTDENQWHTAESISLLAAIAGLFHDFGKANRLFQDKLNPDKKTKGSEPYRHEWVSLRLFQAFVAEQSDAEWLAKLAAISPHNEGEMLERLIKDQRENRFDNPFKALSPLARSIAWLIVSHHRLPKFNLKENEPRVDYINQWMTGKFLSAAWNSPQCEFDDWKAADWQKVWQFDFGTPMRSQTWCAKAQSIAKRALKHRQLQEIDWMQDNFSSHLARLSLMLADHCYSAGEPKLAWQDKKYKAFANTDRKTRELKQKLDEHNIGVGHNAFLLAKSLPKLRQSLPAITRHKGFKQRSNDEKYRWQDKAYELAKGLSELSKPQGFFGVNMASTGCGKTFANARIMYGLADEKLGCRFSVALGLRTLTLQTGDALQARLHLESDDLAVLIGSQAVRQLHELNKAQVQEGKALSAEQSGSESAETLFAEHQYVSYDGSLDDGRLSQWLKVSPKLLQLLSAPVLVSTIDHLIPATEGERGGKQIAPMLRLLTSDLVLDEPDDFDLADLPALCRLVNWAGMLGSRVLLSSATLPPALIQALFDAYKAGRSQFNAACGDARPLPVCCAWFDEHKSMQSDHADLAEFTATHQVFVAQRIKALAKQSTLRYAELLPVLAATKSTPDVLQAMSDAIYGGVQRLHTAHHQVHATSGKRLSIGLVRMANIKPMVALARHLLSQAAPDQYRIHFCIYHSQHPLLVRSGIERQLDAALSRHDPNAIWQVPAVQAAITDCPEPNQLFIVFATAVAEVGRDHDYDWAIAEPSSMRSLIQLAGRIQRHRQQIPKAANLLILNKNYRALKGDGIAYSQPGFEAKGFELQSKDLAEILTTEQYQYLSATPRIQARSPLDEQHNLVDLEHAHLAAKLFGSAKIAVHAALWWRNYASWCFELQRQTPFRLSAKDEAFLLYLEEEGEAAQFYLVAESGEQGLVDSSRFVRYEVALGTGVQPWMSNNASSLIEELAEQLNLGLAETSQKFAEIRLRLTEEKWLYHEWFGVHGELE
ncbi:type I-F CRISPR-associated helicase Cas3f [Iodobacter sp.]|uniref:type I-F CRISPR-associated helicase Cas3f n=1 Tax=Iodobacter sp. TaxID=1915058 RepID=UPI0025CEA392|nr:type I-F CRISPR-associated helicase Cas3f [Iodobacter sp.]